MTLSLLLVVTLLIYRRMNVGLGCLCAVAAFLGYLWPPLMISPYLLIAWRALQEINNRTTEETFPLFIGKLRRIPGVQQQTDSLSNPRSNQWIVAVLLVGTSSCKASSVDLSSGLSTEMYLVIKAESDYEASSNDKKQFGRWFKAGGECKNYHLYHVGWSTQKPNICATINEPKSAGCFSLESALGLAIQMSNLKLYTYFSSMPLLRWHVMICYISFIFFAWCGADYLTQLVVINVIIVVEMWWLGLGVQFVVDTILEWIKLYAMYADKLLDWTLIRKMIAKIASDYENVPVNLTLKLEMWWLSLGVQFVVDTILEWIKLYAMYADKLLDWIRKMIAKIASDYENVPVNLTLKPEMTGRKVVDTVIDQIKHSEIFGNDFGYIKRIAWVESKYGLDHAKTFRPGYHGGVWQMDKAIFEKTKDTESYPDLTEKYDKINSEFDINWPCVQWEDLRKPLHGGLASHLYMNTCTSEGIPSSVKDQGMHWKKNYNREEECEEKFVEHVIDIEKQELAGMAKCK